mmetsp:Transcript_20948/g.42260  ORF Transcript_20948/g.42260 Transcript_20948/m.42260 type:complete len:291 (-) Transcript_20948:104-976(-)|eukprot:CAMPEP_0183323784 /NCGR_PEP_ID=MMETSP0160_2-20130417/75314_1 /TAXON_ID=2839 ORGANISM="Odontella Sinensis, Strain Grunow 1884" /NCGR_SAMPLE_ID=MMETSP0160_2 /ASSEMBLY_ACC=CAM_ASM_000250 /LENGTH=290 /DNA_ID=CAMNT_0025491215 /DNA_START=12 /DNA_END=884 /DNA_ORIENTATION=-
MAAKGVRLMAMVAPVLKWTSAITTPSTRGPSRAGGGGSSNFLGNLVSGRDSFGAVQKGVELPAVSVSASRALQRVWSQGVDELFEPGSTVRTEEAGLQFGRCSLASSGTVCRVDAPMERLLRSAFEAVVLSHALHGIQTRLSRFDLFHSHLLRARYGDVAVLSTLFHCAEYPASASDIFCDVVQLGYCQAGSDCFPTQHAWRYRNVLWASWWMDGLNDDRRTQPQAIWLLDGAADEVAKLRVDKTPFAEPGCPNTIWEGNLGCHIADIYYLGNGILYGSYDAPAVKDELL